MAESTYVLSGTLARLRSRPVAHGAWFHYYSSGGLYMFKNLFWYGYSIILKKRNQRLKPRDGKGLGSFSFSSVSG